MSKKLMIAILFLAYSNFIIGCECDHINSFDLQRYDVSSYILELNIVEEIGMKESFYIENDDTVFFNLPFIEFEAEVVEVFKGNAQKGRSKILSQGMFSSCSWQPEVGRSYILYLFEDENQNLLREIFEKEDQQIFSVYGCQVYIEKNHQTYKSELETLRLLKNKPKRKFRVDQSVLTQNISVKYSSIIGRFKCGKRHGKWILSEPIGYPVSDFEPKNRIVLRYKNGDLISVDSKIIPKGIGSKFLDSWKSYYSELL